MQHMKLLFAICAVILAAPATSHALSIRQSKEIVPLPSTEEIIARKINNVDTIVIGEYTGEFNEIASIPSMTGPSIDLLFDVIEIIKGEPSKIANLNLTYNHTTRLKNNVLSPYVKGQTYLLLLSQQGSNHHPMETQYQHIHHTWYNPSFVIPLEN